ncbi:MAG: hypothetical protein JO102_00550 [Elusimicrobia bacterium]|nr:hypothetical protein [Elusimicrobiota bacterium]
MSNAAAARATTLPEKPAPLWKRRWAQNTALFAIAAAGVYGIIYHDVVSRAREAFEQGELYMSWYRDPAAKRAHFDKQFEDGRAALDAQLSQKKITDVEYHRKLDALEFDRDFAMSESSLKYAYQWYKDTYELFSPPESEWVRQARQKAPEALDLWKQELRAQKIPFDDTMFE